MRNMSALISTHERNMSERFVAELRAQGFKVQYHVVLLTRCGSIHADVRIAKDTPGMDTSAANLHADLHLHVHLQKLRRHTVHYVLHYSTRRGR